MRNMNQQKPWLLGHIISLTWCAKYSLQFLASHRSLIEPLHL